MGTLVRVKKGVTDPLFPDIPLGGWTGRVDEIDNDGKNVIVCIAWNSYTLEHMPEAYVVRCLRQAMDFDFLWLSQEDIEPITSEENQIETPTQLHPAPLDLNHPEDRIRAIFGLTSDDPLPEATPRSLEIYHDYLKNNLTFPFVGCLWQSDGPGENTNALLHAQVLRLVPPTNSNEESSPAQVEVQVGERTFWADLNDLEVETNTPQGKLIADFQYWMDETIEDQAGNSGLGDQAASWRKLLILLTRTAAYGAVFGTTLGALLLSIELAKLGLMIGAFILGLGGFLLGTRYGKLVDRISMMHVGPYLGGLVGAVAGAIVGGGIGILLVGSVGTILGSMIGVTLGEILARLGWRPMNSFSWGLLGTLVGGLILAFCFDQEKAYTGALAGMVVGALTAVFLFLTGLVLMVSAMLRRD